MFCWRCVLRNSNFQVKEIRPEVPDWLEAMHLYKLRIGPTFYSESLPINSHSEALVESDAAQQQPLLNSQERGTLRDIFKDYLWMHKWEQKVVIVAFLGACSFYVALHLSTGVYYPLMYWFYDWIGEKKEDKRRTDSNFAGFSELHKQHENVE